MDVFGFVAIRIGAALMRVCSIALFADRAYPVSNDDTMRSQRRALVIGRLLVFILLLAPWAIGRVDAAEQYCAQRVMVAPTYQCFDSLQKAEQFIRVEPDPPYGAQHLQPGPKHEISLGYFNTRYQVKDRPYEAFLGSLYGLFTIGGWGRHEYNCGPSDIVPGGSWRGCPDEQTASDGFLQRYPFEGGNNTAYFTGTYMPDPPTAWGSTGYINDHGYLYVPRNAGSGTRQWVVVYHPSGFEAIHGVDRSDLYRCPYLFYATTPNPWPIFCGNSAYGWISKQSRQYSSCDTKEGNPCVAATGNKEVREVDFEWEGQNFTRTYNSIKDFDLKSGLSNNWAHSFSDRLILGSTEQSNIYWLRSDGYYEPFSYVASDQYRSRNTTGAVIYREPDAIAATHGRWRLADSSRKTRWFGETGRLNRIEQGARVYVMTYCDNEEFSLGQCNALGELTKVTSATGRTLNFHYQLIAVLVDAGSAYITEARLSHVTADGVALINYSFDSNARLTGSGGSGLLGTGGKVYLYGEPSKLCRDANGAQISNCSAQDFPYHLTGIKDEGQVRVATYTYDQLGRVTSSEHANGAGRVTLSYPSEAETNVSLPTGGSKRYSLDASVFRKPTTVQTTTSDGSVTGTTSYIYDGMRPTSQVDSNGWKSTFGYSDFHEISRTDGLTATGAATAHTRTTQTDWHQTHSVPIERRVYDNTGVLTVRTSWTHNARGQALSNTTFDPATAETRTSTTTYCEQADVAAGFCPLLGLVTSIDGPRTDINDSTTYVYRPADESSCASAPTTCSYRKGDLWKVINALGHVTETLKYDAAGRVLSVKDPNGVITDFEYHPRGWLTARKVRGSSNSVETDDQITRIDYWPTRLVKQVTQPDGSFTAYAYDAAHRLTDIFDGDGNRIHYTLDNAGNRAQEDTTDEQGVLLRTLSRVYNQLGQLQTQKDAGQHPTGFTYDANGNLDTATDALNRVTDNDYDPLNRLQRTLQDVGGIEAETKFEYDAQDNLTKVTDPKGLDTDYTYNAFGDLLTLSSPDTGATTYTYDSAGNRKTQTDARGITATYGYDALNRLTSISYSDGSAGVTYKYDVVSRLDCPGSLETAYAKGRLSRMTDASGYTQYCYDRFGNVAGKLQVTNTKKFDTRYAYTLAGHLQSITYPDGAVVDYVRNGQGQVTEVGVKPNGGTRQVLLREATYYPFGPVAQWTYGNNRLMRRSLNQNYQPGFVEDPLPGGLSIGYEFDEAGNLAKLRTADQTDPPLRLFGYDDLNRLTEVNDGATQALLQSYTYDATGNRESATLGGTFVDYTYPTGSHRLSAVGSTSRSYDVAGNTTAIGGTAREFVYNAANRMKQVKQGGVATMNYVYNGRGEQVRKYLSSSTYTVYDEAGRWLGDYDSTGAAKQQAIWLDDLPVGLLVGSGASQKLHYVEPDALGTPRVVIDPQRDVAVWKWELTGEAFGNSAPNQDPDGDGTQFVLDMRFPGQRYDAASGLNYNLMRDYEPGSGRYVESDPKGLFGDIATYSYAANKPMIYVDPDGQEPVQGCGGGYGVTICDGKGGYTSRNCNKECTAQCTQAHENQHIADYSRRAPDRCRGKKYGDNPGRYSDVEDLSFYKDECRALRVGKSCAEAMLTNRNACLSPQCDEAVRRYIRGIDYYLGRYRCDAYGW